MTDLDALRRKMVAVIALLEDAIDAAMPGQAPSADEGEIRQSILAVRGNLEGAITVLDEVGEAIGRHGN